MPTDPFVAPDAEAAPRNEPTLAPGLRLPPSRPWRAARPGDLVDGVAPRGPGFGSPGPNVGYATSLTHRVGREFAVAPHEHRHDAETVVAALAMRRAASYGRGPVRADVEYGATLLGYLGTADPAFVAWRADAVDGAHHHPTVTSRVVDAIPLDALRGPAGGAGAFAAEVRAALLAG